MASQLNPYLFFDGNAREAMEFYRSVLGGELEVMTFGDMGGPEEIKDLVMHAYLGTDAGYALMASDPPPGSGHPGGNGAVSISGDDDEQIRGYWAGLADGGTVDVPLEKQMWGDEFGQVTDRYGVTWLVNISGGEPPADQPG